MRDLTAYRRIRAIVRCTGASTRWTYSSDGGQPFPQPIFVPEEKKGYMFLPISDILAFVDMLRNERPIFAHLRGDRPEWTSVTTSTEAVGEGEEEV
jgi:hypothetical protein